MWDIYIYRELCRIIEYFITVHKKLIFNVGIVLCHYKDPYLSNQCSGTSQILSRELNMLTSLGHNLLEV